MKKKRRTVKKWWNAFGLMTEYGQEYTLNRMCTSFPHNNGKKGCNVTKMLKYIKKWGI